jgi:quercetin dioxygenase-like cupin family protein
MNSRIVSRTAFALPLVVVIGVLFAATALATAPSGLSSQLVARGAAGEFDIHDKSGKLKLQAKEPLDVAVVNATLAAGGFTGWHAHPGPSIVIVETGTLTMDEAVGGACVSQSFEAGKAFVHPEDAHNFKNTGAGTLEFTVIYLVPAGAAPLLTDVTPAPSPCS